MLILQVVICKENVGYTALGVEIDYCAQGDTPAEARENFITGVTLTLEHIRENVGSISSSLFWNARNHASAYWELLNSAETHFCVTLTAGWVDLPFTHVRFIGGE